MLYNFLLKHLRRQNNSHKPFKTSIISTSSIQPLVYPYKHTFLSLNGSKSLTVPINHSLSYVLSPYTHFLHHSTGGLMLSIDEQGIHTSSEVSCSNFKKLTQLRFSNRCLKALPIDPNEDNYIRKVHDACFSKVYPSKLLNPRLVSASLSSLKLLDLSDDEAEDLDFVQYMSGNKILNGCFPFSHCYCGYQFGSYAGQLGDGAAIYLGEIQNLKGEFWEVQLKGAGKTPYSRNADGRKVLRSSIREYLCSEHMHALNIPTTRAAALISSDSRVLRDQFYNGNNKPERCAVVCRLSPSFLRFGSFEIIKEKDQQMNTEGPSAGNIDILKRLTHFVITTYYPELLVQHGHQISDHSPEFSIPILYKFIREVIHRTARLVAQWTCVGWCHGVLNTDNLSILGLTIDYGPFGFMEHYTPYLVPNTTDELGRYRFENQAEACKWNCMKLCETFSPLIPIKESIPILDEYNFVYESEYYKLMNNKLGFLNSPHACNESFIKSLLDVMEETGADWTNTFRDMRKMRVNLFKVESPPNEEEIQEIYSDLLTSILKYMPSLEQLQDLSRPSISEQQIFQYKMLWTLQPELLLSFGIDQECLKRLENQQKRVHSLNISSSEKKENDLKKWKEWLTVYTSKLYEDFSNSSSSAEEYWISRRKIMDNVNPRIILRNHLAQKAIEDAENGDFTEVNQLLTALMRPFNEDHLEEYLIPLGGKTKSRIPLS